MNETYVRRLDVQFSVIASVVLTYLPTLLVERLTHLGGDSEAEQHWQPWRIRLHTFTITVHRCRVNGNALEL